jgi:drug/metabolite transporter (DMT)-like permease
VMVALGTKEDDEQASNPTLGNLILIGQCCGMGLLYVFQKPMVSRYPPTTTVAVYYSIGMLITAIVCSFAVKNDDEYHITDEKAWTALIFASIVATLYNYNALAWATQYVPSSTVSLYSTLQPVGTTILSLIFLDASLAWLQFGGGVIVLAGMLVALFGVDWLLEHVGLGERKFAGVGSGLGLGGGEPDEASYSKIPSSEES